jgi:hypothetical protein
MAASWTGSGTTSQWSAPTSLHRPPDGCERTGSRSGPVHIRQHGEVLQRVGRIGEGAARCALAWSECLGGGHLDQE